MEATPELSTREREMLQYLEDLQRDNPAEYEQLVQQLQSQQAAKRGAKGSGADGAPAGGQQVTPRPGFVAKTRSATRRGAKVFINICQHEAVDTPQPMEAGEDGSVPLRIPLSLGPPREDLDKDGELCTVYDVVFHPDTVTNSLADTDFRQLMLELSLYQIKQKHSDDLSHEITYPKLKGSKHLSRKAVGRFSTLDDTPTARTIWLEGALRAPVALRRVHTRLLWQHIGNESTRVLSHRQCLLLPATSL